VLSRVSQWRFEVEVVHTYVEILDNLSSPKAKPRVVEENLIKPDFLNQKLTHLREERLIFVLYDTRILKFESNPARSDCNSKSPAILTWPLTFQSKVPKLMAVFRDTEKVIKSIRALFLISKLEPIFSTPLPLNSPLVESL
jgi:hypothetical protein